MKTLNVASLHLLNRESNASLRMFCLAQHIDFVLTWIPSRKTHIRVPRVYYCPEVKMVSTGVSGSTPDRQVNPVIKDHASGRSVVGFAFSDRSGVY